MPHQDDAQISIREFLEFRMNALEEKIDQNQADNEKRISELGDAIANLAKVIVSREAMDTITKKVDDLENRIIKLESQAGIARWVLSGLGGILLALILYKAQQIF